MEELDFESLLNRFKSGGFPKAEQVILSNFGTNQTMLSIIFQEPNRLKMVDQRDRDGLITRSVELYCGDLLVCFANTRIPRKRNRDDVIYDIVAGTLGLGQIVVKHNLPSRRDLIEVGRTRAEFWRTYAIEGPEVYLLIHESFPREPFEKIGWLQPEGG